jgi:hypothetical protein
LPPRRARAAPTLLVALLLCAAHAGAAEARLAVYAPKATTPKSVSFRVKGISPVAVRAASLRVAGARRWLSVRHVRHGIRRGRVVIRLRRRISRAQLRRSVRLTLRVRALRDARRKPGGDDDGVTPPSQPPPSDGGPKRGRPIDPPADPPPADPPPAGCLPFQVGDWPGPCWRPFSDSSPFNRPMPADPRLTPNSSAIVQRMVSLYGGPAKMTAGDADSPYDYSHPLYYPTSTDPLFTLHCYEASWGTCPIEGHKIRIPDAARPAGGGDAHLAVIDQESGWEYDLYKVRSKPAGGGTLEFRWGGRTRLDRDGLGSNATAAHFALSAGIIRAQELAAGRIEHALFMVVKCTSGRVEPALGGGAQCADGTNAPAGGMRFQLDYSEAEIEALPVPEWKKTILEALRTYGAYIGDTGGAGFNFQFESGSTYTSFGQTDELVDWAKNQRGVAPYKGKYVFDLARDVDWSRMRVVDPCVGMGTC